MTEARYGRTKVAKIKAAYDELRAACRAEGTPRIQDAVDRYEQWADYVMGASDADGGWRDIETAPKDGTKFDAWCVWRGCKGVRIPDVQMRGDGSGFGFLVHMRDGVAWQYLDARNRNEAIFPPWEPTHWMPLTAPPASERSE